MVKPSTHRCCAPARLMLLGALASSILAVSTSMLAQNVITVAGGGVGDGDFAVDDGPATSAALSEIQGVAVDDDGNVFIADTGNMRVRKVDTLGNISTVAGNGKQEFSGDGGPARNAGLSIPRGVAVDDSGNLYIADFGNARVRKISPSGIISTVAGNGQRDFNGDGGPAFLAALRGPVSVAVDRIGNLYIVDAFDHRVRKVSPDGIITSVAGNGVLGFSGDGGPAAAASLSIPSAVVADAHGNLFIADQQNERIRMVSRDGIISTIAGGGPFRSDPVVANIRLLRPSGIATDVEGNLYVAHGPHNYVTKISPAGIGVVVAGAFNDSIFGGVAGAPNGFSGDGGPAVEAKFNDIQSVATDSRGRIYLADTRNRRIRRIDPTPDVPTPSGVNAFLPHVTIPVGSAPDTVAVGDVNGDGLDDVVMTTTFQPFDPDPENDHKLYIFLQQIDGGVATPFRLSFLSENPDQAGIGMADFDGDGVLDIIVGHPDGITMVRGSRSNAFAPELVPNISGAEPASQIAIMDFDLDGHLDVVTEGDLNGIENISAMIYFGNGSGSFARKSRFDTISQGNPDLKTGDIDGNGIEDLIIASGQAFTPVESFLLQPDGSVKIEQFVPFVSTNVQAIAIGDFNDDGRADLVLSPVGNAPINLSLMSQDNQGRIGSAEAIKTYDSPSVAHSRDVNGDGKDDLLILHEGWLAIGYYEQTGVGLREEVKYPLPSFGRYNHQGIASGDLNGDSCTDVAIAEPNRGLIILYGINCTSAVAVELEAARDRVWFVPNAANGVQQGFVRLTNLESRPGQVRIRGLDDQGHLSKAEITLTLGPGESRQLNSQDLEQGNPAKGLDGMFGAGSGNWVLAIDSEVDIEPLAYLRTPDGFLTSVHDRVAGNGFEWWVPMFNPAENPNQVSRLRLINTTDKPVSVQIDGIDDNGIPGLEPLLANVEAFASVEIRAVEMEQGNIERGLLGGLGDGVGKWHLTVTATGPLAVQNLLFEPNGKVTNLSTLSEAPTMPDQSRTLWLVPPASNSHQQGFIRLVNRDLHSGVVTLWGVDDSGKRSSGTITLTLGPGQSRQLNSSDLEQGNPAKNVGGSLGRGTGNWRIEISTDLDLKTMAYIRTPDGFLTSVHDTVPADSGDLRVVIFNPAENDQQRSILRLINPGGSETRVLVRGTDDLGSPAPGGTLSLVMAAGAAVELTSSDIENGNESKGLDGMLGNGVGKWTLSLAADNPLVAMSLLFDPKGFVTNLSSRSQEPPDSD